ILTPPHSENALITAMLVQHGIPFARIGSIVPGPGYAMTMGDEGSARHAAEYLIGLGHRRIGFIGGSDEYTISAWRQQGWAAAMNAAGLATDGLCVPGDFSYASGKRAAEALLDCAAPPSAIIACSDQMALAALDTAVARGLAVPGDLSLISFDNSPVTRFTTPQLTAIDQPIAATFAMAVELLLGNRDGAAPDGPVVVAGSLVVRGSTAAPRHHARG
ncbi:MAG: substrate-binding domain-containing protein, partial [Novosphingobium sp.]